MSLKNKTLITVVGPTAIGKTSLAISLAKHFKTEIISCDSRQFYKEMYIGTAVPSKEELLEVKHHFIQNKSIHENYNVGQFEKEALKKLDELFKSKDIVVMVGGSGLYVDAVIKGFDFFPEIPKEIRENLNVRLQNEGIEVLQKELKEIDPKSYKSIAIDNPQRLTRALEICLGTGKPYSSFKKNTSKKRDFNSLIIGLTGDREKIYNRINQRVDLMIANGLIEEANALYPFKNLNALQTVGYRELFSFFDNEITQEFAIEEIKKNTRRFAKRQLTWFRKNKEIIWFDFQIDSDQIINQILDKL